MKRTCVSYACMVPGLYGAVLLFMLRSERRKRRVCSYWRASPCTLLQSTFSFVDLRLANISLRPSCRLLGVFVEYLKLH